jgi:hypothetical protein
MSRGSHTFSDIPGGAISIDADWKTASVVASHSPWKSENGRQSYYSQQAKQSTP